MNELLQAAKIVCDLYDYTGTVEECEAVNRLYEAVERAKNPPTDYNAWTARHSGQTVSPYELWTAAQQAERDRIRARVRLAAYKVWKSGDWYIGPQDHILEKFVEELLRDDSDE